LSTTLVKFEESHGTFNEKWKKKSLLLPTTLINKFERNYGTFIGGGGKNPLLLTTLG
jgi:hypothetical protein